MIVTYSEQGWEVVTQRAHGGLSGFLASQWNRKIRTDRWFETLMAIAGHDDAHIEPGSLPLLTPPGGPMDFKMTRYDHGHCVKTYQSAISKSRYVALLCSMHLDFVYRPLIGDDAKGECFMRDQAALRSKWKIELGISDAEADRDYRLLEWCDALSLLLCQQFIPPQARSVEISRGPDGHNHQLSQGENGLLHIDPWPFETDSFIASVESRTITQLHFNDNADFCKAFFDAEVSVRHWKFSRR